MSQRQLAVKTGISRTRLRRLETSRFDEITVRELRKVSELLRVPMSDFSDESGTQTAGPVFGKGGENPVEIKGVQRGCKIYSLTPLRRDLFIGKLFLPSREALSRAMFPQTSIVFLQSLLGIFYFETSTVGYEVRESNHLLFRANSDFKVWNPLSRDSVALLVTAPSLVLSSFC